MNNKHPAYLKRGTFYCVLYLLLVVGVRAQNPHPDVPPLDVSVHLRVEEPAPEPEFSRQERQNTAPRSNWSILSQKQTTQAHFGPAIPATSRRKSANSSSAASITPPSPFLSRVPETFDFGHGNAIRSASFNSVKSRPDPQAGNLSSQPTSASTVFTGGFSHDSSNLGHSDRSKFGSSSFRGGNRLAFESASPLGRSSNVPAAKKGSTTTMVLESHP